MKKFTRLLVGFILMHSLSFSQTTFTNDIEVTSIEALGKIISSFNTPHVILGIITNTGTAVQNNIVVSLNVTGANPFTDTQMITTLAAGSMTIVSFALYNPLALGASTISVSVPADQDTTNNLATYSQSVTCNNWSSSPASVVDTYTHQSVGFFTGTGIIATPFSSAVTTTLTSIIAAIGTYSLNAGNPVYGVVLDASGAILGSTGHVTLTTASLGTYVSMPFATPHTLTANTSYYLGLAQPASGYYPVGTQLSSYVDPNLFLYTSLGGGSLSQLGQNLGYFDIEGIFLPNISTTIGISPASICLGSGYTLTASGSATSYSFSNSTGLLGNTSYVNSAAAIGDTYSVSMTDALGCSGLVTYAPVIHQLPNISIISSAPSICLGSPVTFTANGAVSYDWNLGTSSSQTFTDTPLTPTPADYLVSGTDANGCMNTATAEVTVNSVTLTLGGSTVVCAGQTATLTAGGAGSYLWNNAFPFPEYHVTPTVSTIYTVTGTDINTGCSSTQTVSLLVNPKPTVLATSTKTVLCKGESLILNVSGASTYNWTGLSFTGSPTSTSVTASPVNIGNTTYSVSGSDTNGCTSQATLTLRTEECTGVEQIADSNEPAFVFPNPNSGSFTVRSLAGGTMDIYNSLGSLIRKFTLVAGDTQIDVGNESAGFYIVYINVSTKGATVIRFIKN